MWNPYKLAKLVNVKAVYNSLHNIFTWNPGERILNPEFGSKLKTYLYEGINEFTSEQITSEIRRCISEFEPRVNVVKIVNSSTIDDTENNTIVIDIIFTIPSLSRE
jgi:phage baseplate assembly protein W